MSYVYKNLTEGAIIAELQNDRYANWSHEAARLIATHLIESAESTCEAIELDKVAIRCDFSEFDSLEDFNNQQNTDYESFEELQNDRFVIGDSDLFITIK